MNQKSSQIIQNIVNQQYRYKLYLNFLIGALFIENSILIIDSIYSIIYQHYELVFMCSLGIFLVMLSLFQIQNTKIVFNYEVSVQKISNFYIELRCLNCGQIAQKFQCSLCLICVACNHMFHSKYLNICIDENQLHLITRNIWVIILKNLICIFVRVYALVKYHEDHTHLFQMFLVSIIVGMIMDLFSISLFLVLQYQIKLQRNNVDGQNFENSEILIQLAKNKDDQNQSKVKSSTDSTQQKLISLDKQNKQHKILDFLDKKLGHKQNQIISPQISITDPMMIDDVDANQICLKMNKLNQLFPISMSNIIKKQ